MVSTIGHPTADKRHANPTRDGDVFFEIDGLDSAFDGRNDSQDDSDSNDEETGDIDELGKCGANVDYSHVSYSLSH